MKLVSKIKSVINGNMGPRDNGGTSDDHETYGVSSGGKKKRDKLSFL